MANWPARRLRETCPELGSHSPNAIDANGSKFEIVAGRNLRFWKERVVRSEPLLLSKERDPITDILANVIASESSVVIG